jgi:hypothetical protein
MKVAASSSSAAARAVIAVGTGLARRILREAGL